MLYFRIFTVLAVVLALSLELYSIPPLWSFQASTLPKWLLFGDYLAAPILLMGSVLFQNDNAARRAFFASGWAMAITFYYQRFSIELLSPSFETSNLLSTLTLASIPLLISVIGLAAAILLPYESKTS